MSESDAALRFDGLLDQLVHGEEPPADALGETARTVQQLHTRQRSMPSDAFRARLRASLTEEVPMRQVNGRHPAAIAVPPVRMPERSIARPAMWHRWLAIAAVLALVIGGIGAFALHPWGNDSAPEPSAIPAAMLGTVESSPVAEMGNWTVAPPAGTTRLVMPGLVADGRVFTVFAGDAETAVVQAVDLPTGTVLWSGPLGNWAQLLVATAGDQLLATGSGENGYALKAYDGRTGDPRWQIELEQRPVALLVHDDQILVLGSGNGLDAFDLGSQQLLWHANLSQYDDAAADDTGMNAYFNLTGSRLTETDGVVGAIVSNGRLVGVDADDGTVRWADERTTSSATTVAVVDDRFVVTASGSDKQGYDYDGAAGTPIPETDRCQAVFAPRSGSTSSEIRPNGAAADSFDPTTGNSPWGVESNRPAWIWPLDDSNLIAMVSPGWDIVNDQPQNMFPCKIDGATGEISDLDPNVLAEVVLDSNSDTPTGMAGFPNGGSFVVPDIDPEVAASLPHVGSDTGNPSASWLQTVDGMTLVALADGTLIGLQEVASSDFVEATPSPDVVVSAEVAWTAPGLNEPVRGTSGYAIDNERLYLALDTDNADPGNVRAIDLDTGEVLWSVSADVKSRNLIVSGDLVLVGGMVLPVGQTEAVVALDAGTGAEVWRSEISGRVASMIVEGDRLLLLTTSNILNTLDLETGESLAATDVSGRSNSGSSVPAVPGLGLTIIDDTLVAVLADGSVAGIDLETGVGKWWALRIQPGKTRVRNVDGALIVVASGLPEMFELDANGSPVPLASPVPDATPAAASCAKSVSPASLNSWIDGGGLQTDESNIMRLDPEDGTAIWEAASMLRYMLDFESDAGIVAYASNGSWYSDTIQVVLCSTDPETGRVHQIDQVDEIAEHAYRVVITFANGGPRDYVLGFDEDGKWIVIPPTYYAQVSGPVFQLSEESVEVEIMNFSHAGALFMVGDDGSVTKFIFPDVRLTPTNG